MTMTELFYEVKEKLNLTSVNQTVFIVNFIKDNEINLTDVREKANEMNQVYYAELDTLDEMRAQYTQFRYDTAVAHATESIVISNEMVDIADYLDELYVGRTRGDIKIVR